MTRLVSRGFIVAGLVSPGNTLIAVSMDVPQLEVQVTTAQVDVTSAHDFHSIYVPGPTTYKITAEPHRLSLIQGQTLDQALAVLACPNGP